MNEMNKIISFISIILTLCLCGCSTEEYADYPSEDNGKIRLTITPETLLPIKPGTRAFLDKSSHVIDAITRVDILFYTEDGNIATYTSDGTTKNLVFTKKDLTDDKLRTIDIENTNIEEETGYRIYVIANLTGSKLSDVAIDDNDENYNWIKTEANLREKVFSWNDEIAKNNIMFGFFTMENGGNGSTVTSLENKIDHQLEDEGASKTNPTNFFADGTFCTAQDQDTSAEKYKVPSITFEKTEGEIQAHLTAKVYRMNSIISVCFDTYNLNRSVEIEVKSVTLYNLPNKCYLWKENSNSDESDFETSQTIDNDLDVTTYNGEGKIVNCSNKLTRRDNNGSGEYRQNEYMVSQFFYMFENRQGIIDTNDRESKNLSSKPKATYVEVKAVHKMNGIETNVVYRYAIGEDGRDSGNKMLYNNYNVTRNRFYKVYLSFYGNGLEDGSETSWRTDIGGDNDSYSDNYVPTYEVTRDKIRLLGIDRSASYISKTGWSVTSPDWLTPTTINGGSESNIETKYTTIKGVKSGDIVFTYETDKQTTVTVKQAGIEFSADNSTWVADGNIFSHTGQHPIYLRLEKVASSDRLYNVWLSDTKSFIQMDGSEGEWLYQSYVSDEKKELIKLKDKRTENGYDRFDIQIKGLTNSSAPVYLPIKEVTILRNAPITIEDVDYYYFYGKILNESKEIVANESESKTTIDGVVTFERETGREDNFDKLDGNYYSPSTTINEIEVGNSKTISSIFTFNKPSYYINMTLEARKRITLVLLNRNYTEAFDKSNPGFKITKDDETIETYDYLNGIRAYQIDLEAGTYKLERTQRNVMLYCITIGEIPTTD